MYTTLSNLAIILANLTIFTILIHIMHKKQQITIISIYKLNIQLPAIYINSKIDK